MKRREFILKSAAASTLLMLPSIDLFAGDASVKKITLLHTNDQHSRIEPFELSKNAETSGRGGFARRATMIHQIRQQEKNVVLLDAGDVFQGTPYFNMFGGELEFKLMSKMGYDVGTLGNHEFDNRLEGLKKQLPHAKFDIINSNYDFTNTILEGQIKPYKILIKDGVKIGVFAVGVELKGIVDPRAYQETVYLDPIEIAHDMVKKLREEEHCDLVICLSHLGYEYSTNQVSDKVLARSTSGIDIIIGGHTHTFLPEPQVFKNRVGEDVLINQVGWAGLFLGRIDFYFKKGKKIQTQTYALNLLEVK
ncbi:bifunctional metallophosphatase/5'-nucleotidase [Vaginella massiliensis]|uniref:bifunctional metallophosphatase/5'-nucleotidase n=1 Tax=Vaginella massiliensis TaxID=1816680 RepID=UPI0008393287|nr:metallophosphatase [Vaginella massiliensis]